PRRHVAHRRLPRSTAIVADEEKSSARSRIYCRGIDSIPVFAIGHYRVHEASAVAGIAGDKILTAISRNHNAVVVSADKNRIRVAGVNSDGIDFELSGGSDHPRIILAALPGSPKAFGCSRED